MSDCSSNAFKVPEKPELLPCPFCHAETRLTHGDFLTSPIAMFKCDKCGAVITFDEPVCNAAAMNHDDTPAIMAYNTRYQPTCKLIYEYREPHIHIGKWTCSDCGGWAMLPPYDLSDATFCPHCGRKVIEVVN